MSATILIIEDESSHLRMAEYAIGQKTGYQLVMAGSCEEAIRWVLTGRQPQPDLLLLEIASPASGGFNVIRDIKSSRPRFPVIALVPYGDDDCAAQAVQAGVRDFLSKPVELERLKLSLRNALALKRTGDALVRLERHYNGHVCFSDVIGHSAVMHKVLKLAEVAAASKIPVWIEGEPGTGKEWLARAIHGSSDRAGKPFAVVDCRELPEETAEAIVFGQEKPQDANHPRIHFVLGKVREAEKGTLFLKNSNALAPALQQRLLEMMHESRAMPVGAAADVRIIAAADRPIDSLVASGAVSHAFYRRFQDCRITVLPLRERREDIALLAKHFIVSYAASENKSMIGLTEDAKQHLAAESWPGNISQLSRLMWQAVMICNQEILDHGNLRLIEEWQPAYYKDHGDTILPAASPLLFDRSGRIKKLKSIEEEIIQLALRHNNGCMTRAARQLGIGRSTLYRRVGEIEKDGYISRANQATRPMMTASSAERS